MSDPTAPERTRTFSWGPPLALGPEARAMSGLDLLRSLQPGSSAPIACALDFRLVEVGEGRAVFECDPQEFHYNPMGGVHGSLQPEGFGEGFPLPGRALSCTLCDSAAGAAVHTTLAPGEAYTTLEIKTNFVRPIGVKTGRLRCEGRVVHRGGQTATSTAELRDAAGKLYAHASATCMILRGERP